MHPKNESKLNIKSLLLMICRLPSGWLSLDRSVLDLVVQSVGKLAEPQALTTPSAETQHSQPLQEQTKKSNTQTTAAR